MQLCDTHTRVDYPGFPHVFSMENQDHTECRDVGILRFCFDMMVYIVYTYVRTHAPYIPLSDTMSIAIR